MYYQVANSVDLFLTSDIYMNHLIKIVSAKFLEKEMATHCVFLPGESQGRQSLVGCRLWGHTESDTTEATSQQQQQLNFSTVNLYTSPL